MRKMSGRLGLLLLFLYGFMEPLRVVCLAAEQALSLPGFVLALVIVFL